MNEFSLFARIGSLVPLAHRPSSASLPVGAGAR